MEITCQEIQEIFHTLQWDVMVYNVDHYQRAFSPKTIHSSSKNNERDEFLGDSFIGFITALYLYERFDDQNEGFLTKMKTKLVNGRMLSELAKHLGFQKYMPPNKLYEKNMDAILEDVFEAFVSALYHDQKEYALSQNMSLVEGWALQQINTFFIKVIERYVDFSTLVITDDNYKDTLLKYFHKKYKCPPVYKDIQVEGPVHQRVFTVSVHHVNGELLGKGRGDTKRQAQQMAAKYALQKLNISNSSPCESNIDVRG